MPSRATFLRATQDFVDEFEMAYSEGLLTRDANKSKFNKCLYFAALSGQSDLAKGLVQVGADVNARIKGYTYSFAAVAFGGIKILECLKCLIEAGADVNCTDDTGQTALIAASCNGNIDYVNMLLEAGAGVNITDKGGKTALTVAAVNKDVECVRAFIKAGADLNARAGQVVPPLY